MGYTSDTNKLEGFRLMDSRKVWKAFRCLRFIVFHWCGGCPYLMYRLLMFGGSAQVHSKEFKLIMEEITKVGNMIFEI